MKQYKFLKPAAVAVVVTLAVSGCDLGPEPEEAILDWNAMTVPLQVSPGGEVVIEIQHVNPGRTTYSGLGIRTTKVAPREYRVELIAENVYPDVIPVVPETYVLRESLGSVESGRYRLHVNWTQYRTKIIEFDLTAGDVSWAYIVRTSGEPGYTEPTPPDTIYAYVKRDSTLECTLTYGDCGGSLSRMALTRLASGEYEGSMERPEPQVYVYFENPQSIPQEGFRLTASAPSRRIFYFKHLP